MLLTKEINIGLSLKKYRLKKKLSQEKVAEIANIDAKHYGRLERNLCYPKIDTFLSLSLALEVDPVILFNDIFVK